MSQHTPLGRLGGRKQNVRWIKCRSGTVRIERSADGYDVSASGLGQRRVSRAELDYYVDELCRRLDGRIYSESLVKYMLETLRR